MVKLHRFQKPTKNFKCFPFQILFILIPHVLSCSLPTPPVWEIKVRKNLTILEGCLFPWFHILISSTFWETKKKNFNLDPCIFNLIKLGTIEPAAHFLKCVNIGRRQAVQTVNCALSKEMMMMMMMINCFCGMVNWRKAFSLTSSQDHCQRSSPSQIFDIPWQDLNLRRTWVQALLNEVVQ